VMIINRDPKASEAGNVSRHPNHSILPSLDPAFVAEYRHIETSPCNTILARAVHFREQSHGRTGRSLEPVLVVAVRLRYLTIARLSEAAADDAQHARKPTPRRSITAIGTYHLYRHLPYVSRKNQLTP